MEVLTENGTLLYRNELLGNRSWEAPCNLVRCLVLLSALDPFVRRDASSPVEQAVHSGGKAHTDSARIQ